MNILITTFTLTVLLFGCTLACRPILRLYESECCGDDYVEVAWEWIGVNNEPNLTAKGIRNYYLRTCPEGLWMGYEGENYTGNANLLSSYGDYDHLNTCQYQNSGKIFRSVKIVGSTASYTQSALSTFSFDFGAANGDDNTYLNDSNNLPGGYFTKIIITGNQEVELFTSNSFGGLSVCVQPNNGYIYDQDAFEKINPIRNGTDIYTDLSNLNRIFGTNAFNSFTFGCRNNTNSLLDVVRYANINH